MKPTALIIVIAIIIGAILVFSPISLREMIASFPLFKSLETISSPQQGAVNEAQASMFRTTDGGITWFPQVAIDAGSSLPSVTVLDVAFDYLNSNIVYLGTEAGLYKTLNNGQNWERQIDNNKRLADAAVVYRVVQDPRDTNNIYVAAFQNKYGVFLKSTDGGVSFFQTYITQLENYAVQAIAIHPTRSNVLYIGTGQGGVFMSEDYGDTWKVASWLTGPVTNIVFNPHNGDEMYAVVQNRGLFRSVNGGREWKEFSRELSRIAAYNNVMMFMLDPANTNKLYLALGNGLVKSENWGRSWEFVKVLIPPKVLPIDAIAIDPKNTNTLYVGAGSLIYQSVDGGVNWGVQKFNTQKRITIIAIDPKDSKSIYMGMKNVKK
ncbi:hypothetical protein A2Z10_02885 [Candidatus Azambacteria bacterium RBG_16_47_10]|uniref:Uncharacterized protein n=1 Tax=Candidatus Azambacteria bacterium RBG_16_47_10 TaxID=1797292 RepID=A0A1F5B0R5_9BACT|nr:MAG: hypothetical protein A2Z10_02885 [Candidatus Azambacteria bacterium RBG_16_47_10]